MCSIVKYHTHISHILYTYQVLGGLPGSEERKELRFVSGRLLKIGRRGTKIRSGGLPSSEERKRTKIHKFSRSGVFR
ncbi:unnamed protein product [Rhizophagus irregularis]|nr:unnamed protein product [Rhizophagus irregularis]